MSNFWTGKLIRLRRIVSDDWQNALRWDQDAATSRNDDRIYPPNAEERAREWAKRKVESLMTNDTIDLVMETLHGEAIGTINSHHVDRKNGVFSYGLGMPVEYQRKGYGSEAVVLLLRYFFGELGFHKCQVTLYSFNEGSRRFHEKLGFTLEGCLRESVFSHGRRYDTLCYGLTAEEFFTHVLPRYDVQWPYRFGETEAP